MCCYFRYAGKKVSRKDIYKDFSSDQSEDEKSEESIAEHNSEDSAEEENLSDEEENSDEDENDSDGSFEDDSMEDEEESENEDGKKLKVLPNMNVDEEIKKGNGVRDQIKVWENLLDMRIKFQKCLQLSNQLPQLEVFKTFTADNDFKTESKKVQSNLTTLLDKLLQLNSVLNKSQTENKTAENDENDDEIPSDSEDDLKSDKDSEKVEETEQQVPKKKRKLDLPTFENLISKNHKSYTSHRNAEIKKWNDKTRFASNISSKKSQIPILQQIDFILKDKPKLIKKTQLKRSEYEIIGKEVSENADGRRVEEYDPEIYDDDDFYHELLREFIHQKTSGITDPTQLSKQWVQLQSMRNKLKRKIDTRATKGRRLRYNIHQKLVNYMAPVLVSDTMTDQAKDELYKSLFSQTKTN